MGEARLPARENRFVVHRPLRGQSLSDRCKVIVLRTLAIVGKGRGVAIASPQTISVFHSTDTDRGSKGFLRPTGASQVANSTHPAIPARPENSIDSEKSVKPDTSAVRSLEQIRLTPDSGGRASSWSGLMRALCLLALIGATLPGCCCSAHRAWTAAYDPCVPQCDECHTTRHPHGLFHKNTSRCPCAHCSSCGEGCGFGTGDCATGCGSDDGNACGGCSSCAQGQTVYDGTLPPAYSPYSSMPQTTTCPTCHQTHMNPMQTEPAQSPPMTPPAPPAATPYNPPPMPLPSAPEPEQARMLLPMPQQPAPLAGLSMAPQLMQPVPMQPLQLPPVQTQPIQYQEWQPHPSVPQSFSPYNPPAQQVPQQSLVPQQSQNAVQPVLWVPPQSQAPLLLPAR